MTTQREDPGSPAPGPPGEAHGSGKRIYVTQPYLPPLEEFIPYLRQIWDRKILTNSGPYHQELEKALCDYLGVEHIALFANGTLALIDGQYFDAPSTKAALQVLADWGNELPLLVVAHEDEEALVKSFRNLPRVLVTVAAELEVAPVVWARAVLVTEAALPLVETKAGNAKEPS